MFLKIRGTTTDRLRQYEPKYSYFFSHMTQFYCMPPSKHLPWLRILYLYSVFPICELSYLMLCQT